MYEDPIGDREGQVWVASPRGTRTRASVMSHVDAGGKARTQPLRWVAAVAMMTLLATTAVWMRHDPGPLTAAGCPVTAPQATPFTPPSGRATPPSDDAVWIGDEHLWTVLDTDGGYTDRKSVWWSVDFPGGTVEEQPPISVTALQLDGSGTITPEHPSTNAYTVEDGWFMIADFPIEMPPGCWEITGTYKGTSLSYVVEVKG